MATSCFIVTKGLYYIRSRVTYSLTIVQTFSRNRFSSVSFHNPRHVQIGSCPTCRGSFMGRAIALEKLIRTIRGDSP